MALVKHPVVEAFESRTGRQAVNQLGGPIAEVETVGLKKDSDGNICWPALKHARQHDQLVLGKVVLCEGEKIVETAAE